METDLPILQDAIFFLDATPLLDRHYTGIPVVCANLARELLAAGADLHFTLGHGLLPRQAVQDALRLNTGLFLEHEFANGTIALEPLQWPAGRTSIGLSTSVKRLRRVFDIEASIIHDITTILHPQYHMPENIAWHAETILEDIASNDVTFCVSEATRQDLIDYLGADPARLVVAYNGVEWPWYFPILGRRTLRGPVEPFILILATQEPRKNLSVILDTLAGAPELLERCRFVFVGKTGWLQQGQTLPATLKNAVSKERLIQAGFVSEQQKYLLLRGAAATIFPSFYEGFGLPLAEATSVGTPCIAARSSSLVEIDAGNCLYIDPCDPQALHHMIRSALANPRSRATTLAFRWVGMAEIVLAALQQCADASITP